MKNKIITTVLFIGILTMSGCSNMGSALKNLPGGNFVAGMVNEGNIEHWKESVNVTDAEVDYEDNLKSGNTIYIKGSIFTSQGKNMMFQDFETHKMTYIDVSEIDKKMRKYLSKNINESIVIEAKAINLVSTHSNVMYKAVNIYK